MEMVKHFQNFQNSKFEFFLEYLEKEVRVEVDLSPADKYQNFLQVDLNTLSIKFFYKEILSLLMDIIKHSQSTQSNKLAVFFLKKHFNKNLIKKVSPVYHNILVPELLLCSIVTKNVQIFSGVPFMFVVTCFCYLLIIMSPVVATKDKINKMRSKYFNVQL